MEGFLYSFALKDFLRLRRILAWILVGLGLFGIALLIRTLERGSTPETSYLRMASFFLFRVLALVAAIFSTAVLSAEMEQKTIVYLLTRPIPRAKLIFFRTLAASTVVAVIGLYIAICIGAATYGLSMFGQSYFHRDVVGVLVGSLFYTAFFTLLSLWINRSMIVSLLYAFGWESIIPNMPGDIRYLSIASHLETLSQRPSSGDASPLAQLAASTMTPTNSWVIAIVATMGCLLIASAWFRRNEYLPREDVE